MVHISLRCNICAFVKYSIFQWLEKVLKAVFAKVLHGFGAFVKYKYAPKALTSNDVHCSFRNI